MIVADGTTKTPHRSAYAVYAVAGYIYRSAPENGSGVLGPCNLAPDKDGHRKQTHANKMFLKRPRKPS